MTLDEAIAYHERIANIEEQACFMIPEENADYEMHKRTALHHKMLVKWLTELKRYRDQRGISIEDFEDAMDELQNDIKRRF